MNTSKLLLLACASLAMTSTACVGLDPAEGGDELTDNQSNAVMTANALTANALTANALTANALTANALTANALTANALTANALMESDLLSAALKDASARQVLHYVVGCALPSDAKLTIEVGTETLTYAGSLGLAPSWGEEGGTCDESCQGWVSACVLARVNNKGVSVPLSMRGDAPSLETGAEEQSRFVAREATYFGNVFQSPQRRFACLSPGQESIPRVCGDDSEGCVVDVVGTCDVACSSVGSDGGFQDCTNEIDSDGEKASAAGKPFAEAVTIFLQAPVAR